MVDVAVGSMSRMFAGVGVAGLLVMCGGVAGCTASSAVDSGEPIETLVGSGRGDVHLLPASGEGARRIGDDVPRRELDLDLPRSVAVGRDGTVYVADGGNHMIYVLEPGGDEVRVLAGDVTAVVGDKGDGGPARESFLGTPDRLAVDPGKTLYFLDFDVSTGGETAFVRAVDLRRGTIETLAGADELTYPSDLAVGPDGSLYVADIKDDRVCRLDLDAGDCATVAEIDNAGAVTVGPDGTLYVAQPAKSRVSAVDPKTGEKTTVAGTGRRTGELGDGGPATSATLGTVGGLAVNGETLYLTDVNYQRVRAVDLDSGDITTIAGTGRAGKTGLVAGGFAGDGGPAGKAKLAMPWDLAVDGAGALYIADMSNNRVRAIGKTETDTDDTTSAPTIYLIGLTVCLAALVVVGVILLRPGRRQR